MKKERNLEGFCDPRFGVTDRERRERVTETEKQKQREKERANTPSDDGPKTTTQTANRNRNRQTDRQQTERRPNSGGAFGRYEPEQKSERPTALDAVYSLSGLVLVSQPKEKGTPK